MRKIKQYVEVERWEAKAANTHVAVDNGGWVEYSDYQKVLDALKTERRAHKEATRMLKFAYRFNGMFSTCMKMYI